MQQIEHEKLVKRSAALPFVNAGDRMRRGYNRLIKLKQPGARSAGTETSGIERLPAKH